MDLQDMDPEQTREHFAKLAHRYAQRYAGIVVEALGGTVSEDANAILHRIGFELGHDACQTLAREIRTRTPATGTARAQDDRPTITVTRDQLECWAGRPLTDDEVYRLDECVPQSSIPDAIADIAGQFKADDA